MATPHTRLRVSVLGCFVDAGHVLLIHQVTPPEPDRWDLPGGGLQPEESLLQGLRREVQEETSLSDFEVKGLLTIVDSFFPEGPDRQLHALNIIYHCGVQPRPIALTSTDPEIGPKGIQWLPAATLTPETCTTRTWAALQAIGLVDG